MRTVSGPQTVPQLAALAAQLPSLEGLPGTDTHHFDATLLDEHVAEHGSPAQRAAAQFLLSVANPSRAWLVGRFDLVSALSVDGFGPTHARAIAAWLIAPWVVD